jgi:hypothetical protein
MGVITIQDGRAGCRVRLETEGQEGTSSMKTKRSALETIVNRWVILRIIGD